MNIGGLQKTTLIDFPETVAAVIFTVGCNFSCPFCFNKDLMSGITSVISQKEIFNFLKERKGFLDGVVISGGEPTIQPDLIRAIREIREMGYKIKLDTNGSNPKVLEKLLQAKLLDYVAMDVKTALNELYAWTIRIPDFDLKLWKKSLQLLIDSGIEFELRTTIVPDIHDKQILVTLAQQIAQLTSKPVWYWQNFQPKNCLDVEFTKKEPLPNLVLSQWLSAVKKYYDKVELRNG